MSEFAGSLNLLCIDTSDQLCSVALQFNGAVTAAHSDKPRSHAQVLLPLIDTLLKERDMTVADLDAIAVTQGPGSFTGVRIGLSTAQGLAFAAKKPLLAVGTLDAMLQLGSDGNIARDSQNGQPPPGEVSSRSLKYDTQHTYLLVPALDARMSEFYWCAAALTAAGWELMEEARVDSAAQMASALNASIKARDIASPYKIIAYGSAWTQDSLIDCLSGLDMQIESKAPQLLARSLVEFINNRDPDQLLNTSRASLYNQEPLYLRNEITWKKRKRIRTLDND